jgi:hypothetical protein
MPCQLGPLESDPHTERGPRELAFSQGSGYNAGRLASGATAPWARETAVAIRHDSRKSATYPAMLGAWEVSSRALPVTGSGAAQKREMQMIRPTKGFSE